MKAGTVAEKIDGVEITPDADYYTLLNNKARKKILALDPDQGNAGNVIPITNGAFDFMTLQPLGETACGRLTDGRVADWVTCTSSLWGDDSFRSSMDILENTTTAKASRQ